VKVRHTVESSDQLYPRVMAASRQRVVASVDRGVHRLGIELRNQRHGCRPCCVVGKAELHQALLRAWCRPIGVLARIPHGESAAKPYRTAITGLRSVGGSSHSAAMLRSASVAKPCNDSTLRLFATIPHEGSGLDPTHVHTLFVRNPGYPRSGSGFGRSPAGEGLWPNVLHVRAWEVVPDRSTEEGDEQSRYSLRVSAGAETLEERVWREGSCRRIGIGRAQHLHQQCTTRLLQHGSTCVGRVLPERGAGCGNTARPDLCGGRPARAVPTVTDGGSNSIASFRLPFQP